MPYAANRDIPEGVRSALPAAAQTVWRTAYNGAAERGDLDEAGRMRIAWGAVRRAGYRRPADGGKWVKKVHPWWAQPGGPESPDWLPTEVIVSDPAPPGMFVAAQKFDDDQQLAYGWLYVSRRKDGSQVVDHSGEVVSIEELEKAATAYALDHREAKEMHTGGSAGRLVEIWVSTPEKRAAMGIPEGILPDGIWVGYKVDDTGTWKKIRSGQLKMFSLGGRALRQALKLLKEAPDAQAV